MSCVIRRRRGLKEEGIVAKAKQWCQEIASWFKDTMTLWTKEEADKISVEDFMRMPLVDLAKGVNPASVVENASRIGIMFNMGPQIVDQDVSEQAQEEMSASITFPCGDSYEAVYEKGVGAKLGYNSSCGNFSPIAEIQHDSSLSALEHIALLRTEAMATNPSLGIEMLNEALCTGRNR